MDKLIRLPIFTPPKKSEYVPRLRSATDDEFNTCAATKCKDATTPAVLQARYGFPTLTSATSGNSMACAEFEGQGIKTTDLSNFAKTCGVNHVVSDRENIVTVCSF